MFNYSTSVATFESVVSSEGGHLLQVSGMRVTYNTELVGSRLISIEIFDSKKNAYLPLERLRLYTFSTDSYLCGGYDEYPELLGSGLVFEGEQGGSIGSELHQDALADYLRQLDGPFDTSIQGRLTNNTDVTDALNLIESPDSCLPGWYYNETWFSCELCPAEANVNFLSERVELEGETGANTTPIGQIDLVNSELFPVSVSPKSVPSWVMLASFARNDTSSVSAFAAGEPIELQPGERISVGVRAMPERLETGTALATVSFGVLNGGNYPGCTSQDLSFDVFMRVTPTPDLNQLGSISILGWTFAGIVLCTALFFCTWVVRHRKLRIVRTMQPVFLVAICVGVFIMGLSIIPLSIDDGIASERGCDIACMAIPWLFSIGFTVSQSALFSKLWRINKLFNAPQIRRMQVQEKDVLGPFVLLFGVNFTLLLVFTLVDPLYFERKTVNGEAWNTYGVCTTEGAGDTLFGLIVAVNLSALFIACYQAYKARNVSDEFSESRNLGIAMFSWVQLLIVGIPVIFLIDADNPTARYFIVASLIFGRKSASVATAALLDISPRFTNSLCVMIVCESMLLLIFVPMLIQVRQSKINPEAAAPVGRNVTSMNIGRTRISGINFDTTMLNSRDFDSTTEAVDDHVGWVPAVRSSLVKVEEGEEEPSHHQNEMCANSSTCSNTDSERLRHIMSDQYQGLPNVTRENEDAKEQTEAGRTVIVTSSTYGDMLVDEASDDSSVDC